MTTLDWFITAGSFGCFAAAWAWFCVEISRKISSGGPLSPSDANSPTPYAVNQTGRIYAGEKWTANADKRFSEAGAHGQSVQIRPARHSLVHWLAFHRSIT